jgi:hypothetical protein
MARKVEFLWDPEEATELDIPRGYKEEARKEIADFILEKVLEYTADGKSSVDGRPWAKLSKEYKKHKEAEGSGGEANLQLSGDMLDALRAEANGTKIKLFVAGSESDKADGHCNHSGESELPLRRFIPSNDDGESFSKEIVDGVRDIIKNYQEAADGD